VPVSVGTKAGDEAMLENARQWMEAGATDLTFGRNIWQREPDESMRLAEYLSKACDGRDDVRTKPADESDRIWSVRHHVDLFDA
jgi:hypothetical protein